MQGRDDKGAFRTGNGSEVYPPLLAERLARPWCVALEALEAIVEGGAVGSNHTSDKSSDDDAPRITEIDGDNNDGDDDIVPELKPDDDSSSDDEAEATAQPVAQKKKQHTAPRANHFPLHSRVEVYWHKMHKWYGGRVVAHGTSRTIIKGDKCLVPDIQIQYDDGALKTHMLHANAVRPEEGSPSVAMILDVEDEEASMIREDTLLPSLHMILKDREELTIDKTSIDDAGAALLAIDKTDVMHTIEAEVKKSLEQNARESDDVDLKAGVHSHAGECLSITDLQFDIEGGLILNKSSLFLVSNDGKLLMARTLDTRHAKHWHTPSNERDYNASPQRDLWRTSKELKWDKYLALNMFEWIPISAIDTKQHRIYATLWVYKIKFEEGLKFSKLNPRWCLKGGTMDREKFKAHAETLRIASYRTILACKGGYWKAFCEFLLDCSDAFQSTRTDDVPEEQQTPLYCWPAPGFEQRTPTGERMACKVKVAMQGRIDATLLFTTKLFELLVVKCGMTRLVWDRQVAIYHGIM